MFCSESGLYFPLPLPEFCFTPDVYFISCVSSSLPAGDFPLQRGHHVHQQHVPSLCSSDLHWLHPLLQGEIKVSVSQQIPPDFGPFYRLIS